MDIASASNAMCNSVSNNAVNLENFLISIVTGIISSLIITFIYRRIDDKRAQITFLSELYVFSEKANVLLYNYLLSLKRESVIGEVMELLNTKPVWFKWVKFGQKEDQRIVRTVYEESVQLLVDIAEIEKCEKLRKNKKKGIDFFSELRIIIFVR